MRRGLREVERRWLGGESEAVPLLESRDVFNALETGIADFEKVGFEKRDAVRKEFSQRPVQIVAQRRVQSVLKDVCELAGDFGKARESVAGGGTTKRMRGNVQALEIFAARLNLLQDADVFTEILQMLRCFLEEELDGFAIQRAHARPSVTSSGFWDSSAVGLRYKMQSFNTMAWNFTGILEMDSEWPRKR